MMLQPADNDLITKAQGGDKSAFEALVRENYDVMFRIAFKWCGNQEDAEDITQNACIKLARNIDGFQFKSAFTSWLYRLVINTAIDYRAVFGRQSIFRIPNIERRGLKLNVGNRVRIQNDSRLHRSFYSPVLPEGDPKIYYD